MEQDHQANTVVQHRDVFLSHSGVTRGVVSTIHWELLRPGNITVLDIDDLVAGQWSQQTLKPALLAARAVVVVVKAVPVFYKLKRSECRAGSLSAAVEKALHKNPRASTEAGYQQLVADLDAIACCGNLDFSNPQTSDTDVAVWVVREVALKVGSAAAYLPPETRGIDEEVERLADLLKGGGMLGLYGPGGVGKTTLATALYNRLLTEQPHFQPHGTAAQVQLAEFVDDKHVKIRDELMCLNDLLIQMGSLPLIGLPAADIDVDLVTGVAGRPLLLFCDNVWDSAHLQRLLAHFKSRSKASVIIATSRSTRYFPRSTWLRVALAPIADLLVREQIISAYAGMSFNGLSHAARQHLDSILVKSSGLPLALQAVGRYIAIEEDPTDARSWQP
ncbi:hypothetical protein OEZ85_005840 [Tetradesmus obliquus]|uniref:NB-ARC domain-containing protein n=1 Tax=Tetradesmus obliquus TaxID=3088 RepID=A0ABY8UES1_TETOB|nr:hypothetical protein OEZ85_005840 [Tetradesmus obliquus]